MSTNVRQFRFLCYIWHSWRCVLLHGSFLCCHLLYLIIYLLCMVLPLKIFLTYCSTFAKYSTGFHEKSNLVQILRAFFTKQYFSDFFAQRIKRNNTCALYYASQFSTIFKCNTAKIKFSLFTSINNFVITAQSIRPNFFFNLLEGITVNKVIDLP